MTAQPRTSISKIFTSSALAALLIGGATGAGIYSVHDKPSLEDYAIQAPVQALPRTEILDPDNVLTDGEEAQLLRDSARITAPDTVKQLHYLVFAKNKKNVNDSVEEYLRAQHADLIGDKKFTDGVLIVGVGLDPRQAFIFAGEDVADQLDLRVDKSQWKDAVDAIKPGVRDGNIQAGLFAGARAATDVEKLADRKFEDAKGSRLGAILSGGLLAGAVAGSGTGVAMGVRRRREKTEITAREDLAFVTREYRQLANRLDSIDIRANSLTSPLAHKQMRAEWAEVREHFLSLHERVEAFGGLTTSADSAAVRAQAKQIGEAATVARQVGFAEQNIDTLFKLEHGDEAVRRSEVAELRKDIVAAQGSVKDASPGLYLALTDVKNDVEALAKHTQAPEFLERFATALTDYQTALTTLREQQFADVKDTAVLPTAPAVYESNYRPGYGYADFVPFWVMQSWHTSAIAYQNSSSSSANASFSSGFSGAGGSSSF